MDIYSSKKKEKYAKKHTKKMSSKKKRVIIALSSVLFALAIILGVVFGVFIDMLKDYNHNEITDNDINNIESIDKDIVNIALFGIDTRTQGSFKGLSDSIMILSINTSDGKIKIISIMRDSLVEIPGKKENKINAAYSIGGPELAIKTLNHNYGLDIKEYATVNFYGMADIIDAVGGVEVEVRAAELNAFGGLNACITEQAQIIGAKPDYVEKAGLQNLNGIQAVAWARIRMVATSEGVANDFGRTDRQRYVMEQLLNKAIKMEKTKYPSLIKALLPHMETSLSYSEILNLAGVLTKQIDFEQTRVPQQSYTIAGPAINRVGSYVYYNLDFASDVIHAVIYEDYTQDQYLDEILASTPYAKKPWYTGPVSKPSSTGASSTAQSSDEGTDSQPESTATSTSSEEPAA